MNKKPETVNIREMNEILERYLTSNSSLNYAIKISGNPGVGKSAIVKEIAVKKNFHFIDTRLAFKENIDLGGYPVPDHDNKQMIYYRPRFIPPKTVPEGFEGIVWFLDESNRAHPTIIQTLFQIITEKRCGEHQLPDKTFIVLAGNLGEEDNTTITEFDDSALDGRLAIFHLKPSIEDWLIWAEGNEIDQSIINYLSIYPEKRWDERTINPNPRGWHQVSMAIKDSYKIESLIELKDYFFENSDGTLKKIIYSLVGKVTGNDFILQLTAPRSLTTEEILSGSREKLLYIEKNQIPAEDLLWALSGAVANLKHKKNLSNNVLMGDDIVELKHILQFIGKSRADLAISFFLMLIRDCGIFTQIPEAVKLISDEGERESILSRFKSMLEG